MNLDAVAEEDRQGSNGKERLGIPVSTAELSSFCCIAGYRHLGFTHVARTLHSVPAGGTILLDTQLSMLMPFTDHSMSLTTEETLASSPSAVLQFQPYPRATDGKPSAIRAPTSVGKASQKRENLKHIFL